MLWGRWWILGALAAALCGGARAESLEAIDNVVRRARGLDDLLARPELLDEYFGALQSYYGRDKFGRDSFDAILKQLREAVAQVPELRARLWETTDLGTGYEVRSTAKTSGRTLEPSKWQDYLLGFGRRLGEGAEPKREKALATLGEAQARVDQFERETPPGRAGAEKRAEFYRALREDRDVSAAVRGLLAERLQSEEVRDLLRSGDADVVLGAMRGYHERPQSLFASGTEPPPITYSLIKGLLPDQKELLAREEIFPIEMRRTGRGKDVPVGSSSTATYRFVPIPRRLHGIWKGVPIGECVGGNPDHFDGLTPERWATIALAKSQLLHVERLHTGEGGTEASYSGWVHFVPVQTPTGDIVGSLEIGAPVLRQNIFSDWLAVAQTKKPAEWKGFAVGSSSAIANAGALPTIRASAAYAFGESGGDAAGYVHLDPLAAKLVTTHPREGLAEDYGGRMITEITVKNAGAVTILKPDATVTDGADILRGGDAAAKKRLLRAWAARRTFPPDPEIGALVADLLADKDAGSAARELFHATKPKDGAVNLRLAEMLDTHPALHGTITSLLTECRSPDLRVARRVAESFARGMAGTGDVLTALAPKDEEISLKIWAAMDAANYPFRRLIDTDSASVRAKLRGSAMGALILAEAGRGTSATVRLLAAALPGTEDRKRRIDIIRAIAGHVNGRADAAAALVERLPHEVSWSAAEAILRGIHAIADFDRPGVRRAVIDAAARGPVDARPRAFAALARANHPEVRALIDRTRDIEALKLAHALNYRSPAMIAYARELAAGTEGRQRLIANVYLRDVAGASGVSFKSLERVFSMGLLEGDEPFLDRGVYLAVTEDGVRPETKLLSDALARYHAAHPGSPKCAVKNL